MQQLPRHRVKEHNDVAHPVRLLWFTTLPSINVGTDNSNSDPQITQITQIAQITIKGIKLNRSDPNIAPDLLLSSLCNLRSVDYSLIKIRSEHD